ncbi:MAG: hypothetical protein ACJAQ1_001646 [Flavobacterium sp.]
MQAEASPNNIINVFGNLTINSGGVLDMDDNNSSTVDGVLKLSGNWTNNIGTAAFLEGNGKVQFSENTPQIINNVIPEGTEVFYDVQLSNNFNTSVSNNLIALGNLTIYSNKLMIIDVNNYVRINKKLTNDGNVLIESSGQMIQVDETDTNIGTYTGTRFQVKRNSTVSNFDYVYWSSPVENFDVANMPNNNRYFWNPQTGNANGTVGNWNAASGPMQKASGYIIRSSTNGILTANFLEKPFNGSFTKTIFRGNYNVPVILPSPIGLGATIEDDNWNFVGNPYSSAISATNS